VGETTLSKTLLTAAIAAIVLTTAPAAAADWELAGSWRVNVTCRDYTQVNNLTIGRADASRVTGTTNVNDGFGKITGGSFDGRNFTFTNQYSFDGRTYTEAWSGSLSNNGKSLRGKFKTNNTAAGGCSYRGKKV
jgi:hypothetical protein